MKVILPLLALVALVSCESRDKLFTALPASQTGLSFQNTIQEDERHNVFDFHPVYNGAGVAVGDIDGDGFPDLYFAGNMVPDRLYLNKGNRDGQPLQFEDISEKAGLVSGGWSSGVTMADVNADGRLDIYVSKSGNYPGEDRANQLYVNQGGGRFKEMARQFGLADTSYTNQAVFFDYDKDGDLDAYLITTSPLERNTNRIDPARKDGLGLSPDKLYRNEGNGTFTDVSTEAGIVHDGYGLGLAIMDINEDGYDDVWVSNDFLTNDHLYINQGDGSFLESSAQYFKHTSRFGMGNDAADYNNDGRLDLIQLDMLPRSDEQFKRMAGGGNYVQYDMETRAGYQPQFMRNTLQLNLGIAADGQPRFAEIGQLAEVPRTDWSWAPLFADFDNDGLKDLFVTNGYLRDVTDLDFIKYNQSLNAQNTTLADFKKIFLQRVQELPAWNNANYFFKNKGDLTFEDVSETWTDPQPSLSNGAVYADLDLDGDLDIVTNNVNAEATFLRNNSAANNHFLPIKLKGPPGNPFGIGVAATVFQTERLQKAVCRATRGYASSVESSLHFGLGESAKVDSLLIEWPDGKVQVLREVEPGKTLEVDYRVAVPKNIEIKKIEIKKNADKLLVEVKQKVDFPHTEIPYVDYDYDEKMLLHKYSQQGPKLATGDVDGDGREDFFAGGSYGHYGRFFLQDERGNFTPRPYCDSLKMKDEEDVGVLLFDADADQDLDLYLVSGSNEYADGSKFFQDRLYLNDGEGHFTDATDRLPPIRHSGSCVRAADFDGDGDLDLFRGGRLTPSRFPEAGDSYLLINDNGTFRDGTAGVPGLQKLGMVTDARWLDVDRDSWLDLVVVGELMPITLFRNEKGKLGDPTELLPGTAGLWNCLSSGDFDRDGDIDVLVGNVGLNTSYRISSKEPLTAYASDFDGNGSFDAIPALWKKGKEVPMSGRDLFVAQLPTWKSRFQNYASYAAATMQQVLSADQRKGAVVKRAVLQESVYLENQGDGKFTLKKLPTLAQFAPIQGIATTDVNHDGHLDAILVGNDFSTEPIEGRYDASSGLALLGDGKGNFQPAHFERTGFLAEGDCRDVVLVGDHNLVVSRNANSLKIYRILNRE
ncbi:VCBS repeat-containing protein [Persicitalea sp.]|uniref:VCBS repeat-containing protein n=1 Tax=Persicitalea sp. TaxID=3100273 RepID=UPI00359435C1